MNDVSDNDDTFNIRDLYVIVRECGQTLGRVRVRTDIRQW